VAERIREVWEEGDPLKKTTKEANGNGHYGNPFSSPSKIEAYKNRLRLLREIISGENQTMFAKTIGMDFKRWNNFERGYPLPMKVAFMLFEQYGEKYGFSVDWIWWGKEGNLSPDFKKKLQVLEGLEREAETLRRAQEEMEAKQEAFEAKRRKAIHPSSQSRR
jgi:DNA-binding XRE family transcriptional regulator